MNNSEGNTVILSTQERKMLKQILTESTTKGAPSSSSVSTKLVSPWGWEILTENVVQVVSFYHHVILSSHYTILISSYMYHHNSDISSYTCIIMSNHLARSLPQPPSQLLLSPAQHGFKQILILRVSLWSRSWYFHCDPDLLFYPGWFWQCLQSKPNP